MVHGHRSSYDAPVGWMERGFFGRSRCRNTVNSILQYNVQPIDEHSYLSSATQSGGSLIHHNTAITNIVHEALSSPLLCRAFRLPAFHAVATAPLQDLHCSTPPRVPLTSICPQPIQRLMGSEGTCCPITPQFPSPALWRNPFAVPYVSP